MNLTKKTVVYLLGIMISYVLFYSSVFHNLDNILNSILETQGVSSGIVIAVGVFNLFTIYIGILIYSLIGYVFGRISYLDLTKKEFLYIFTVTMFLNTLVHVPLAIANFFSEGSTIILSNQNYWFIVFNPFLLLATIALFKMLKKRKASFSKAIGFCGAYWIIQITGAIISKMMLSI
ncbi:MULTISPECIES: hypothetical protein [Bacillus]|uniref:hypothetical protein n=1 Tax=Bacillus TaxID=1386 RepID=UPI00119D0E39|nr:MULTISPECIES: hypothetical protein [Bacillus]MDI0275118.1 hypothetical protein [Bacillus safensis]QRY36297.1 hypothetical protein JVX94_13460 [Bacillus sp. PDNC022]